MCSWLRFCTLLMVAVFTTPAIAQTGAGGPLSRGRTHDLEAVMSAIGQSDGGALLLRMMQLFQAGDYAGATEAAEQLLAATERQFGANSPETVVAMIMVANQQRQLGDFESAEASLKRALAICDTAMAADDPAAALALGSLGMLYVIQRKHAFAEPLLRRSLSICEKTHGPDHADTASSLYALAELYATQGAYELAEPLFKRALAIREKANGPDHLLTSQVLDRIAALYRGQGDYDLAQTYAERSVAVAEANLGPDHPVTANRLGHLALLYSLQGRPAQAEQLLKRTLSITETKLGPDHVDTGITLMNLASSYLSQGRYGLAEPSYNRALTILERAFGPDHPFAHTILIDLAIIRGSQGRWLDAARLYDGARRGARRHVARVLPALPAAEQAAYLRTHDHANFHGGLTLGLRQMASREIAALSAGWLANGKAVAHEAASQQIILARKSEGAGTKAAVQSLERVRTELSMLTQTTPSADESAAYRALLTELQAEENRIVHEIGGQLAALHRDEPWVEIDAIRKNIPTGSVLVDIGRFDIIDAVATGVDQKWQPARYAAWIVPPAGKGDVTILDLGEAESIDGLVATYRKGIEVVSGKDGFARAEKSI